MNLFENKWVQVLLVALVFVLVFDKIAPESFALYPQAFEDSNLDIDVKHDNIGIVATPTEVSPSKTYTMQDYIQPSNENSINIDPAEVTTQASQQMMEDSSGPLSWDPLFSEDSWGGVGFMATGASMM